MGRRDRRRDQILENIPSVRTTVFHRKHIVSQRAPRADRALWTVWRLRCHILLSGLYIRITLDPRNRPRVEQPTSDIETLLEVGRPLRHRAARLGTLVHVDDAPSRSRSEQKEGEYMDDHRFEEHIYYSQLSEHNHVHGKHVLELLPLAGHDAEQRTERERG